jgi:hypothetical protein
VGAFFSMTFVGHMRVETCITIPDEFRQPAEWKGILRGVSELNSNPNIKDRNRELLNATREGGPRNGVFTGIEDFIKEHPGIYEIIILKKEFGLGLLVRCGENRAAVRRFRWKVRFNNWFEATKTSLKRFFGKLDYVGS